jgi:D-alanyl-D-alanine-carboxypeptidase/D-alanyl-D-alanine-endopeptidase
MKSLKQSTSPLGDLLMLKKMSPAVRVICLTILLSAFSFRTAAEDFTNAIHAFLQQRIEVERLGGGIVVGLVDEHGSRIVACGKLDNGTDQEVNGDTLFEIGSITKTFTALLLQDMIERGEMKLDDPVAKYLPKSVKMPTRNGKEITLRQLVLHTSGLPANPINLGPTWADYTADQLYAFLSGYKLMDDPGARYKYSNLGASLLGHVIALKAGTNYESLVVDRICRPLRMNDTRITLTPELKARLATGHNQFGDALPGGGDRSPVLLAQGALRSTANELLKYVSAHLGLTRSSLTPLLEKTHEVPVQSGMPAHDLGSWFVVSDPQGRKFVLHGGDTDGYSAFAGFDEKRRRGAVILCSSSAGSDDVGSLGALLLECEWQSDKRPKETKISSNICDSYVGQYQRSPHSASAPGIGIRREGDSIFALATGPRSWPMRALLPTITGELLPESETRLFGRLSGMRITISRDDAGKVTSLTLQFGGETFSYEKISDQPPQIPEPPKQPVAIKLDTKFLDACVGHYEFATNAALAEGMKLTLRRQGDHLVSQAWAGNDTDGPVDVYPESETKFFDKFGNQWTFMKNGKGEVTAVILHGAAFSDYEGKKLKNE